MHGSFAFDPAIVESKRFVKFSRFPKSDRECILTYTVLCNTLRFVEKVVVLNNPVLLIVHHIIKK